MEVHSFKLRATFIPISFENFPIVKLSSGNTEVLRETNSQPGGGVLAHFITLLQKLEASIFVTQVTEQFFNSK